MRADINFSNEEGLPIAIEFLGRPFSEPKLIQLAYAYEQASRRRVAPTSTPHLPGEVFSCWGDAVTGF